MANRKDDHLRLAQTQFKVNPFWDEEVTFVHQSLPQLQVNQISPVQQAFHHSFAWPFFINAMTGGSPKAKRVNERLAQVAQACHLALAVGSMSPIFKDKANRTSYTTVRELYPDGFLLANLSLNYTPEEMQEAVDVLAADALQLHLNAPQELVMPEGDRDFSHWLKRIEAAVQQVSCPVIVKEVGFGMSQETVRQLLSIGVQAIDVSGQGGTSFTQIESSRRLRPFLSNWSDWGIPTPLSLLEARAALKDYSAQEPFTLIASGGIQTPMDVAKALALGSNLVGLSGIFLKQVSDQTTKEAIAWTQAFQEEFILIMALLGCQRVTDLSRTSLVFGDRILRWSHQRHLPLADFHLRS